MTPKFAIAGGNAKDGGAETGIKNAVLGTTHLRMIETAKAISPVKTWGYLAELLCLKERAAKHRIAGTRELTVDELAALIRSEHGLDFLVALMADAEPAWWRRVKAYFAAIDAQRLQQAARRRLREAIDADADLTAAIGRADALLVHDEDFYRPHADAVRAAARVSDRAVARKRR
jgi:hypothetical protein